MVNNCVKRIVRDGAKARLHWRDVWSFDRGAIWEIMGSSASCGRCTMGFVGSCAR